MDRSAAFTAPAGSYPPNPRGLYDMLARVKPIIGPKTPVTVPQIWINGKYVGGADALSEIVHRDVEPNPDRGQCSISPGILAAAE